jgi:hypothetical protein
MSKDLLNKLTSQDKDTIGEFLRSLGCQEDVFSCRTSQLCQALTNDTVYVYATDKEILLVLPDHVSPYTKERAALCPYDSQKETYLQDVSSPETRRSRKRRVSPLWKLCKGGEAIHEALATQEVEVFHIHCMLVTNSYILNDEEIVELLQTTGLPFDISLLDGCYDFIDSLYFNPLPINPDSRLAPWRYLNNLIGPLEEPVPEDTEHDTMTSDEEEFAQLLNQFINGDYEKEKEEDEEEPRIELPAEAPDADPLRQLILQAKQAVRKKDD